MTMGVSTEPHRKGSRIGAALRDRASASGGELEQALLRLLLIGVVGAYLGWAWGGPATLDPLWYAPAALVGLGALALLSAAWLRPRPSPTRRVLAIAHDTAAISIGLFIAGPFGAPLYPLYLLVTLGNGVRFGTGHLYLATSLSLIGYSLVIVNTPYWLSQLPLSIGLMLGLAVVPLYVALLLQRHHAKLERTETANRSRNRLLADITEELREPLHGITGMSDLLRETPLNQEQREYTDAISRSAGALVSMAGNLEDYARIERGQLESRLTDFDLHTLLNGVLRTLRPEAQTKSLYLNLHIDPEIPFQLHGDASHLRQILANLVFDAIQRTRLGGISMRVNLRRLQPRQVELEFEIEATCSALHAISMEHMDAHRDDSEAAATHPNRSGLAVAIARRLIVALHGSPEPLAATSRGTVMAFHLPLQRQQRAESESGTSLERTRVLLVSDERSVNLSHLKEWLRSWHAQLDVVETASAAFVRAEVEARRGNAYHAVVIDKPLIDLDTRQFARALNRIALSAQTALILITPPEQTSRHEALRDAGYSCVLSSPVDKRLLFNALHSAPVFEPGHGAHVVELRSRMNRHRSATKAHILVAEDNPTSQKFIFRVLNGAGHEVELVNNGEEALDALEIGDYDLVIVDMHMPVMDGVQAVKLFRFIHPDRSQTPFVMLTANATTEARMECDAAGVDTFLSKPVDASRLLEVIDSLLEKKRTHSASTERGPARPRHPAGAQNQPVGPPVLNLASLDEVRNLGYGSDFFHELVQGFIRDGNGALEKMEDALGREDYADFRDAAQALKSNAGTIGAVKLYKCCQQPERMNRADFELMASQLASDIGMEFRRACSALIEYSKQLGNNARN